MSVRSKLSRKESYWLDHIKACEASGQSSAEFCKSQDISVKCLYSYRSRLRAKKLIPAKANNSKGTVTPKFVKISVVEPAPQAVRWTVQTESITLSADLTSAQFSALIRDLG